jgi:putative ABC transport system permease protein
MSYDKHFSTRNRVLRLYSNVVEKNKSYNYGICLRSAFTEIPTKIPEIEASTQLYRGWRVSLKANNQYFNSLNLLYTDQGFFDVFGLNLLYGDRKTALEGEGKIVISSSTALKIFNRTDCIGQVIGISGKQVVISGVIRDLPKNTHFNFDLLCSMQTIHPEKFGSLEFFTYYLIRENTDIKEVGRKIALANDELMKPIASEIKWSVKSGTEILSNLHLHSCVDFDLSAKADLHLMLIVAGIAFFILLIALVNHVNLYVLHGEKRIAEIAMRKSLGADSKSLSRLFYSETGMIGFIAFILAIIVTLFAQPYFGSLMQRSLSVSDFFSFSGIVLIISFLAFIILISGAYPSFYLSRLNLVIAFKGKSNQIARKSKLSMASVLIQFTVTVFLISSLVIIYSQVNYLKHIPLGFSPENIVGISGFSPEMRKKYQSIQEELDRLPFIESTGPSFHYMGGGCSGQGIKVYEDPGKRLYINEYRVQQGFCETMKLQLLNGRFFTRDGNEEKSIILNEAAVKMMGIKNPVGSLVQIHEEPMTVIGVVKDFYYTDHSGEQIAPLAITDYSDDMSVFYFRVRDEFTPDKRRQVEAIFKKYDPDFIFSHFLLTNTYLSKFDKEERVMKLVSAGAFLAILISIVGLMALSILNVTRRTKEIGIRKIIGSSETKIMVDLLRETFVLVLISTFIAFIACYLFMQQWLSNFVNKIHLHPGYFLISGLIAMVIAMLTVSWQSWKAATRNPVEALRYE